jgi:hypothetical protein
MELNLFRTDRGKFLIKHQLLADTIIHNGIFKDSSTGYIVDRHYFYLEDVEIRVLREYINNQLENSSRRVREDSIFSELDKLD